MKKFYIFLFVVILTVVLASCVPMEGTSKIQYNDAGSLIVTRINGVAGTLKFYDKDAGVICWVHGESGIFCIPIGELKTGAK